MVHLGALVSFGFAPSALVARVASSCTSGRNYFVVVLSQLWGFGLGR